MNSITQRYYDRIASNLLYLSLAFGAGVLLFAKPSLGQDPALGKATVQLSLAIAGAFLVYQYYCIRQGKLWAKVLLLVWSVGGLLFFALDFHRIVAKIDTPLQVANNVLGYLSQAVASGLVFRYKFVK